MGVKMGGEVVTEGVEPVAGSVVRLVTDRDVTQEKIIEYLQEALDDALAGNLVAVTVFRITRQDQRLLASSYDDQTRVVGALMQCAYGIGSFKE